MAANAVLSAWPGPAALDERLERGEIVVFPRCPFALPQGDDSRFLFNQCVGRTIHKNISYNPGSRTVSGFRWRSAEATNRLRGLLAEFSTSATAWLAQELPRYAAAWRLDRVSFHTEEEAIRPLRQSARNDLLHIDAFPTRPSHGCRILRLYVNINPSEPRVWVTSEPIARLIERYGPQVGLPAADSGWARKMLGLFQGGRPERSEYDAFMLRLHHFLKSNDEFQERCSKRYWTFPPGSAWLLLSDGVSHGALRGRFALDHSCFIAPETLALPEQAPAAILDRLRRQQDRRAA